MLQISHRPPLPAAHLEVWCGVAGAEVRLPVVEAEVAVLRHQALAALKVGLHVRVNLQPVRIVNVPADLAPAGQGMAGRQQARKNSEIIEGGSIYGQGCTVDSRVLPVSCCSLFSGSHKLCTCGRSRYARYYAYC